jgi:hypothetical protein
MDASRSLSKMQASKMSIMVVGTLYDSVSRRVASDSGQDPERPRCMPVVSRTRPSGPSPQAQYTHSAFPALVHLLEVEVSAWASVALGDTCSHDQKVIFEQRMPCFCGMSAKQRCETDG